MAVDPALARRPLLVPGLLSAVVVGLQIAYPLVRGGSRDHVTVLIVFVFAAACVTHAGVTRGPGFAAALLVATAVPGYAVEVLGVHTGVPFGSYAYSAALGPGLFAVPPVVGLAWTMLAWPAAVAARVVADGFAARVIVGGWALAVTDLFLDPQQVSAGCWRWDTPSPHLPGVPWVPLTNFAGWLAVSLLMSLVVQALLASRPAVSALRDAIAIALYLWLFLGWLVALGVFLQLRAAAGWGALGMGSIALPVAMRLCSRSPLCDPDRVRTP